MWSDDFQIYGKNDEKFGGILDDKQYDDDIVCKID